MLQEFFYIWELTLVPEGETGKLRVAIKDPIEHPDDPIKVEPDVASISDIKPKWMSGFEEPSRKPDYYERIIQFTETLDKTRPARITIRRPIRLENRELKLAALDFSRTFDADAENCRVVASKYDGNKQSPLLLKQFQTLIDWRYPGLDSAPLPVRADPNVPLPPLNPAEVEITLEARCQDPDCKTMEMRQMEARKGSN